MRCLVTGGEGFIGSHVVDKLILHGHEVRVLGRSTNRFRGRLPGVDYVLGSVSDQEAVASAVRGIEVVLHLAWSTLPKTSNDDPSFDIADNVIGTVKLLESCVRAGVRKVVFASSGGTIYGIPRALPIFEWHPTDPISSYGISKLAVEKYLGLFHRLFGLEWISLRCSNPYGERQNLAKPQGVIALFLYKAATGGCIEVWGDGSAVRDYVYVGDVAEAFARAATCKQSSGALNIASGRGRTLNEVIDILTGITGRKLEVRRSKARDVDVPANVLDITKARQLLDWSPTTDLGEGIGRTWSWISGLVPDGNIAVKVSGEKVKVSGEKETTSLSVTIR